jgi:hypothetical protein
MFLTMMLIGVFLISFTSCASYTGIVKQSTPMSESCVLDFENSRLLGASMRYGNILYSARKVCPSSQWDLNIVPAGRHIVSFRKHHSRTISITTTTRTYVTWAEEWSVAFDFIPGKYYTIHLTGADFRVAANGVITTNTPNVRAAGSGYNVVFTHIGGSGIEIRETPNKELGSVYTSVNFGGSFSAGPYEYGPSMGINFGPLLGVSVISGWLNMFLAVEANIGIGLTYPIGGFSIDAERKDGFILSYNYGGFARFALGPVALHFGGGMGNGNIWAKGNEGEYGHSVEVSRNVFYHSIPYIEFGLGFAGQPTSFANASIIVPGLHARYYFTDDKYNSGRVFIGVRAFF